MSDSADTAQAARPRGAAIAAMFAALVLLTSLELVVVVVLGMGRAERITTLAGLLMAKFMLVLLFVMRARVSQLVVRLALAAIALAATAAIVLMLETVFRVGVS